MKQYIVSFKKQAGFTLLEFIIGIAIMGILGAGIMAVTSQTIKGNVQSRSQMQVSQQIENVGSWVTHDVQMSKTVTPGTGTSFLRLTWYDESGNNYAVTYSITGTKIQRIYVKNGGSAEQTIIADSINTDPAATNCSYSGGILTIRITSVVGTVSNTKTYQIKNRPV